LEAGWVCVGGSEVVARSLESDESGCESDRRKKKG
jgi:hypothetical protein